ncbi:MAG: Radical SAM domain protein [Parcubacteria group bacterium GW2011_GWA2_48_9]|nr:MAG: Radical SAM domain protein [Parcubacteria group bacterium GW2011_GWA2_48_9]
MKIALVKLPVVGLQLKGYAENPIYLGNVYKRTMPSSLLRVASVLQDTLDAKIGFSDLHIANPNRIEDYKEINWEGCTITAQRFGAPFGAIDDIIKDAAWLGISSHFTFDFDVVREFIAYAKSVNPRLKIMLGGADVKAQPYEYLKAGADLVFTGDINPYALNEKKSLEQRLIGPFKYQFEKLVYPDFSLLPDLTQYSGSQDGSVPSGVKPPIGFLYFTRGCPRECDFCESRFSGYETLDLKHAIAMANHYKKSGINALNIVDDNLLLQVGNPKKRRELIELFNELSNMGFAWEFPNGLEIGMLARNGKLDEELINALFYRTQDSLGNIIGGYRLYFPIETFSDRGNYRKLKGLDVQNSIIEALAQRQIPEIAFGIIVTPKADEYTFQIIKEEYGKIKHLIEEKSLGKTKARYGIFHLIPIAAHRQMKTKYKDSELWNFYIPPYDGTNFSAKELFRKRMELTKELDPVNFQAMAIGRYGYS